MNAPLGSFSRRFSLTSSSAYSHFKGSSVKKEATFLDACNRHKDKSFAQCLQLVCTDSGDEPLFLRDNSLFSAFGPKIPKSAQLFLAAVYLKENQGKFEFSEFKAKIERSEYAQIAPELKQSYFENIHDFMNTHQGLFRNVALRFVENLPMEGGFYTGQLLDGKIHGYGAFTGVYGDQRIGEWKDEKLHGYGCYIDYKGHVSIGQYKDGKMHGYAITTKYCARRRTDLKYVGQFIDGVPNGLGKQLLPTSSGYLYLEYAGYTGQFKDGAPNGYGTQTFTNRRQFVGQFKGGVWGGYGTQYDVNNTIRAGLWDTVPWWTLAERRLLSRQPIPAHVVETLASIEREMPAVMAACEEARAQAKEVYLKVQNMRYTPRNFPLIQGENSQGQTIREPLPNVITGLIGQYAAPDWVGDGKGWNIDQSSLDKAKVFATKIFLTS